MLIFCSKASPPWSGGGDIALALQSKGHWFDPRCWKPEKLLTGTKKFMDLYKKDSDGWKVRVGRRVTMFVQKRVQEVFSPRILKRRNWKYNIFIPYFINTLTTLCDYSRLWNKRSPWNNRSPPPLKIFHILILLLFYINPGIAVIYNFFFLQNF